MCPPSSEGTGRQVRQDQAHTTVPQFSVRAGLLEGLTRISREMSNRNVHFFGVYTITNMLDKKITKFQPQKKWGN